MDRHAISMRLATARRTRLYACDGPTVSKHYGRPNTALGFSPLPASRLATVVLEMLLEVASAPPDSRRPPQLSRDGGAADLGWVGAATQERRGRT
jgi:hypothetical protein